MGDVFIALSVAIVAGISLLVTGGSDAPVAGLAELIAGTVAATTLGLPTAISAVGIGIAARSAGALNDLRKYELTKISDTKIKLTRKK